jgi:hypothetical protein
MRDKMSKITIKTDTKERIKKLAKKLGYKQITTLEYLLLGKIKLEDL